MKKFIQRLAMVVVLGVGLISPTQSYAIPAGYQQCEIGDTCAVGEFLYDDSYAPVATAACSITSRYPNGSVFVNSQSMSATSDGWYSYDIQATGSAGLYRSQICCTSSGDYMCLDKSFEVTATSSASTGLSSTEVASAVWDANRSAHTASGSFGEALQNLVPSSSDIAAAVWGYSGRTLSGFGTLVSDIWSHSTRSITSFSSVAADVWGYASRTLTDSDLSSGSLATKSDVDSVKSQVSTIIATASGGIADNDSRLKNIEKVTKENRLLIEQLVNKPIISNFLEESDEPDLNAKLNQTRTLSTNLYVTTNRVGGKLGLVSANWGQISTKDIKTSLADLSKLLGDEKAPAKDTIIGNLKSLKDTWKIGLVDDMYQQSIALKTRLVAIETNVALYGKPRTAYRDIEQLQGYLSRVETQLGETSDLPEDQTLFGYMQKLRILSASLDKRTGDIDKLLAGWKSYKQDVLSAKAQVLVKDVASINTISHIMTPLQITKAETNKQLKNKILGMRGVVAANRVLLARGTEKPLVNFWLEEGSIVFKTLVTNPSALISQTVPLKYYLPKEVTKESIISVEEGLTVEYDTVQEQYYVSGEFVLVPEEARTFAVTVDESIYRISKEEIATLRKQADELARPLKNTSFFAQGVTIKSDIDVSLDKIEQLQKSVITPEGRIRAYREAQIELKAVKTKMEKLKELVTEVSSAGSLAGFIGGSQAVAVWGLIIIMVAGFVSLVLYMRVLRNAPEKVPSQEDEGRDPVAHPDKVASPKLHEEVIVHHQKAPHALKSRGLRLAAIIVLCVTATSATSGFVVYKVMSTRIDSVISKVQPIQKEAVVLGAQVSVPVATVSATPTPAQVPMVRKSVTIAQTDTGFLRVRKIPSGVEVGQVLPGEQYDVLEDSKGWLRLRLHDGLEGWVLKQYTAVVVQ